MVATPQQQEEFDAKLDKLMDIVDVAVNNKQLVIIDYPPDWKRNPRNGWNDAQFIDTLVSRGFSILNIDGCMLGCCAQYGKKPNYHCKYHFDSLFLVRNINNLRRQCVIIRIVMRYVVALL